MRKLSVLVKTPVSYLYGGLYLQCTVFLLDKMYTEFCENLSDLWFVLCWKLSPVRNLVHQHRSGAKARWEFLSQDIWLPSAGECSKWRYSPGLSSTQKAPSTVVQGIMCDHSQGDLMGWMEGTPGTELASHLQLCVDGQSGFRVERARLPVFRLW